jgi:hypothetical protein
MFTNSAWLCSTVGEYGKTLITTQVTTVSQLYYFGSHRFQLVLLTFSVTVYDYCIELHPGCYQTQAVSHTLLKTDTHGR